SVTARQITSGLLKAWAVAGRRQAAAYQISGAKSPLTPVPASACSSVQVSYLADRQANRSAGALVPQSFLGQDRGTDVSTWRELSSERRERPVSASHRCLTPLSPSATGHRPHAESPG